MLILNFYIPFHVQVRGLQAQVQFHALHSEWWKTIRSSRSEFVEGKMQTVVHPLGDPPGLPVENEDEDAANHHERGDEREQYHEDVAHLGIVISHFSSHVILLAHRLEQWRKLIGDPTAAYPLPIVIGKQVSD